MIDVISLAKYNNGIIYAWKKEMMSSAPRYMPPWKQSKLLKN